MALLRDEYFPKDIQLAAQHAERTTGCPTCVTLAQWAIESGYGRYSMGDGNNPFGMKWSAGSAYPAKTLITREWVKDTGHPLGHYITVEAQFIKFPNTETAFIEHGKYLMNPNGWPEYIAAAKQWRDHRDWEGFIRLMAPRYATGPHYAADLINVVNRFHLYDLNLPS
jgi:flagellum-specific peptidoglycan hydrolase FlgJ